MSRHLARTDRFGGGHYGFCHPCGFYGPFRRWAWFARWDVLRHTSAGGAR